MPQAKTLTAASINVAPVSQDKNGVWTFREVVASTKSINLARTVTASCVRKPKSGKYVVTIKVTAPDMVDTTNSAKKAMAFDRFSFQAEFDERITVQKMRTDVQHFIALLANAEVAKLYNDLENFQ